MRCASIILVSGWAQPPARLAALGHALAERLGAAVTALPAQPGSATRDALAGAARPVGLVGWSMGAMLAVEAAAHDDVPPPEYLGLLAGTLRFTAASPSDPGVPPQALRAQRVAVRCDPHTALDAFMDAVHAPARLTAERRAVLVQAALDEATPAALRDGLDWLATTDLREAAARLRGPVVALHGACDAVIPPACLDDLAKRIDRLRTHRLDEAGHAFPVQTPNVAAELLVRAWEDGP